MTMLMKLKSRAKINWLLKVGPVRPDSYHELQTVFQELDLGEPVTVSAIDDPTCDLTGFPPDIPAAINLVTRAWQIMRKKFPRQVNGISFSIDKILPHGGGIGGGSSNCAVAIRAINELYQLKAPVSQLQQIGGQIGSDVAFFIRGGTAVGRARGEILEQLDPIPNYWLVLLTPRERMSTREAYALLDESQNLRHESLNLNEFLTKLYSGNPYLLGPAVCNDFELVAEQYPWFSRCREALEKAGALRVFLCGSGSTVAGLAADEASARIIAARTGGIVTATRSR